MGKSSWCQKLQLYVYFFLLFSRTKSIIVDKTIANRIPLNGQHKRFISLKDHTQNFMNNPKTRPINLAKNKSGRLSKSILDKINELRNTTSLN